MGPVTEGQLSTGVPFLRLGQGPSLLVASGLTAQNASPTGWQRRMSLGWAPPLAEHFTVYLVNRRAGLESNTTMADLAADYAGAIERDLGGTAFVHGTSTGGSIALQLAIDHPDLVRRLVVAAAACRLSPHGRQVQAEVGRLVEAGDRRSAVALLTETLAPRPLAYPARGVGWLVGGRFQADSDMVATIAAEDSFDVESDLHRVTAPTLVLGGTADPFYSEDLFRRTAAGIPDGRAEVMPGKSHGYVAGSKVAAGVALGFLLG
jgi:pimeloyl-ACP methyl ester carboxylesterase